MKFLDDFKKKLKFIERSINSSRTPEGFLMQQKNHPEIERVQNFLSKYSISQIFKAQMYNRHEELYCHDGYFGIVLKLQIEPKIEARLYHLLKFGFPERSFLNFTMDNIDKTNTTIMSLVTKEQKNKAKNKNNQHILTSISKKIIQLFMEHHLNAEAVRPSQLLEYCNLRLAGKSTEKYDSQQYIFTQIKARTPEISPDGVLTINGDKYIVFYTKQYPNVQTDPFVQRFINPLITISQDFMDVGIEFYYSVCIDLENYSNVGKVKSVKSDEEKYFLFNTTIFVKYNEFDNSNKTQAEFIQDIIEYFRYKHDWYIFQNRSSSFQRFMNSFPLQYDQDTTELIKESSINQIFPLNKIAELLPIGVSHE